jgi:phage protein D
LVKSAKGNKAGSRKAKKAAAAAAPAGDSVVEPASAQEAKHERKQKQGWQQAHAFRSAAGSSDGIAEGRMSVAEEEMVKHALTQMECP